MPEEIHPHSSDGASLWTRRQFTATAAAAMTALAAPSLAFAATPRSGRRKKIALLATEVRKYSHAQHFIDRFLEGYGWHGRHHRPPMELAGLYVDQFPDGDLTSDRSRRHRVKVFPTVEETLTLGRSNLAVDGVVIIAEHGLYPRTEKGQTLYPRHEFFDRTVKIFESSGRAVPVFNDKHLSTDWKECVAMVETSKRLGFPFLAGSSLPVTWRIPAVEMPLGTPLVESVCVCYGGLDSYDIHGIETAQCMSERRAGGETGIKSVQALRGPKVWEILAEREDTRRLFFSAMARSFTCKGSERYSCALPDLEWLKKNHRNPLAYFYEHLDGFRTSVFLLDGFVTDFNYAGLERGGPDTFLPDVFADAAGVLDARRFLQSPGQSYRADDSRPRRAVSCRTNAAHLRHDPVRHGVDVSRRDRVAHAGTEGGLFGAGAIVFLEGLIPNPDDNRLFRR